MRKDLPIKEICKNVYLINEFDGTNCYLIVGSEKALLIDCGTGFCDLRGACEEITDKPIILVATHGHCDHIGGAGQFESMYIHKDDCQLINKIQLSTLARKIFLASNPAVKAHGFTTKDVKKGKHKTNIVPISEGHSFNLGDKVITVHHTPGHTKGSIALIDDADKLVFSGDNVCDALWMQLPGATTLEEWLPSAHWLRKISKTHRVFWGHRVSELTTEYIDTVINWGTEIIKEHQNTRLPLTKQYPNQSDGIIYKTNKVRKKW